MDEFMDFSFQPQPTIQAVIDLDQRWMQPRVANGRKQAMIRETIISIQPTIYNFRKSAQVNMPVLTVARIGLPLRSPCYSA